MGPQSGCEPHTSEHRRLANCSHGNWASNWINWGKGIVGYSDPACAECKKEKRKYNTSKAHHSKNKAQRRKNIANKKKISADIVGLWRCPYESQHGIVDGKTRRLGKKRENSLECFKCCEFMRFHTELCYRQGKCEGGWPKSGCEPSSLERRRLANCSHGNWASKLASWGKSLVGYSDPACAECKKEKRKYNTSKAHHSKNKAQRRKNIANKKKISADIIGLWRCPYESQHGIVDGKARRLGKKRENSLECFKCDEFMRFHTE